MLRACVSLFPGSWQRSSYWTATPCSQHATSPPSFGNRAQFSDFVGVCNDRRSSSGFRQRANVVLIVNSDETAVVTRIAVCAPLTTDDDDERRTIQDGRQSRSYMGARNIMPSLRSPVGGYRPRGVAPAPLPRAWPRARRGVVVVWRCTPPGGRAVLSEVCGRFKSSFARFRHAAPRNQHPRSRVSSRRLREM